MQIIICSMLNSTKITIRMWDVGKGVSNDHFFRSGIPYADRFSVHPCAWEGGAGAGGGAFLLKLNFDSF
jgi:hypothetical protein